MAVGQIAPADISLTFVLPPAYSYNIMMLLAADMAGPLGFSITEDMKAKFMEARRILQSLNIASPRISTAEAGQSGKVGVSTWNWKTGNLAGGDR